MQKVETPPLRKDSSLRVAKPADNAPLSAICPAHLELLRDASFGAGGKAAVSAKAERNDEPHEFPSRRIEPRPSTGHSAFGLPRGACAKAAVGCRAVLRMPA